jgi:exonuclease VII small subunit
MDSIQIAHAIVKLLNSSGLGPEKSRFIAETFFEVGNPVGQAIILLIMALFGIALVILLYNFIRMFIENRWLRMVIQKFPTLSSNERISNGDNENTDEDESDVLLRRKRALDKKLTKDKDELTHGISTRSIVFKRITSLFQIRSVGDLTCKTIKEILFSEEVERAGLPRYFAGVFIILGLSGTVLGLSQSVVHMQPVLSNLKEFSDLEAVSRAITETLTGMRTAFSATIAGLVATIFLSFINFLYGKYAMGLLNRLENFTTISLVPHFLVSNTEEAAIRFADVMTQSTEALDRSSNPLLEMTDRFQMCVGKLESVTQKLESVGALYNKGIENLTAAQKDLHRQQDEVKAESTNHAKVLADSVGQFNNGIRGIVSGVDSIKEAFIQALDGNKGELEKLLQNYNSNHEELIKKQHDMVSRYEKLLKMEQDRIDGIVKIYDLASLVFDKNYHEAALQKESNLINTMADLGRNMNELISELYARSNPKSVNVSDKISLS